MSDSTNPQIVDTVENTLLAVVGAAPATSQALAYESLAHAVTLMMQNAVQAQFGMQQLETAAVATTCALIAASGKGGVQLALRNGVRP